MDESNGFTVVLKPINMKEGWEYKIRPFSFGSGGHFICRFPNGYGVSVVRFTLAYGTGSYGAEKGLFELAVLEYFGDSLDDYELTYGTPITDDVIGHLTIEEVGKIMDQVAELPPTKYAQFHD